MKNSKKGLDEMQKEQRNSIGNQMFILMFYALLFNSGLYGAGIRWLNYPADIIVIISICMGIYLVRLIKYNSYLPSKALSRKNITTLIIAIAFSIILAISAINLFSQSPIEITQNAKINPMLILMIISAVGLLITLVISVIKRVANRDDEE